MDQKIRCQMVGLTKWPDGATRVVHDTQWTSRTDGQPDRCPTKDQRAPNGGGQVPDGEWEWPNRGCNGCPMEGGVSRGGPMEEYINGGSPQFWPL